VKSKEKRGREASLFKGRERRLFVPFEGGKNGKGLWRTPSFIQVLGGGPGGRGAFSGRKAVGHREFRRTEYMKN